MGNAATRINGPFYHPERGYAAALAAQSIVEPLQGNDFGQSYVDLDWSIVDLTPEARVARGMAYVEATYPTALWTIDPARLDLGSTRDCVLGQIHGSYADSPEWLSATREFRQAHGFLLLSSDTYDPHTGEWYMDRLWRKAFRAWASR